MKLRGGMAEVVAADQSFDERRRSFRCHDLQSPTVLDLGGAIENAARVTPPSSVLAIASNKHALAVTDRRADMLGVS